MPKYYFDKNVLALEVLPPAELADTYPMASHRPEDAYSNKDRTIFLSYNHTKTTLYPHQLKEYKENVIDVMYKSDKILPITDQIGKMGGYECIFIENVILGEEAQKGTYNLLFVRSIENRMFLASFTGPEAELESLAPAARQIVKSIEVKL